MTNSPSPEERLYAALDETGFPWSTFRCEATGEERINVRLRSETKSVEDDPLANLRERLIDQTNAIGVGPGWFDLVARLDRDLVEIAGEDYSPARVKQDLGRLDFFARYTGDDEDVENQFLARIGLAQREAARTCEECGGEGTMCRTGFSLQVLCPHHAILATLRDEARRHEDDDPPCPESDLFETAALRLKITEDEVRAAADGVDWRHEG